MAITLGHNQYGKAETRVVRIYRDSDPHELVDYNVSVALVGDFDEIHYSGDNSKCLRPTPPRTRSTPTPRSTARKPASRKSFGLALAGTSSRTPSR